MSREHPILFSAPMVRAILAGTKTQTRRAVKPQPIQATTHIGTFHHPDDDDGRGPRFWSCGPDPMNPGHSYIQPDWAIPCPYGQPGDRLWVREAWQSLHNQNGERLDGLDDWKKHSRECFYRADESDPRTRPMSGRWRPSIHMPRWASRITLEIAGVRVERLQDISVADAIAEGIEPTMPNPGHWNWRDYLADGMQTHAVLSYKTLWESINGRGSWDANPWVWVVEFQPLKGGAA